MKRCDFCGEPATNFPADGPDAGRKLCDSCAGLCSICAGRHAYGATCVAISRVVYDIFSPDLRVN